MRHTHLNCWWNVRLGWTISRGACASSAAMSRCALQPSWLQTACMVNWYSTCCCVSHNQPLPRMAANSCHLCNCLQPMLVHAVLAALPTSVRHLVLQVDCRGPLLNLLRRFPQLDSVAIGYRQEGNGADVQWAGRGAAAVLPKLTALRLNYRDEPRLGNTFEVEHAEVAGVPTHLPHILAAATRLTSLELMCKWDADGAQVCAILPALQDLRCVNAGCPVHAFFPDSCGLADRCAEAAPSDGRSMRCAG